MFVYPFTRTSSKNTVKTFCHVSFNPRGNRQRLLIRRKGNQKCDLSNLPGTFTLPTLLFSRSFHVLQFSGPSVTFPGSIILWHVPLFSATRKSSLGQLSGKFVTKRGFLHFSRLNEIHTRYRIKSFQNCCFIPSRCITEERSIKLCFMEIKHLLSHVIIKYVSFVLLKILKNIYLGIFHGA